MRRTFRHVFDTLAFNLRTLLVFELFYRILGVLLIIPIARAIVRLSMRASGLSYVSTHTAYDFLSNPVTIILLIVAFILIAVYFTVELVFLGTLFQLSENRESVPFLSLLHIGAHRIRSPLRKGHVLFLLSGMFFIVTVELLQFAGVAATMSLPPFIMDYIYDDFTFRLLFYGVLALFVVLFFEGIHLFNITVFEKLPVRKALMKRRAILRGRRFKFLSEFIVLNVILNIALYLFYALIVLFAAAFIWITFGQETVLGILLTVLYIFYFVAGFVASLVLVPINHALTYTWYRRAGGEPDAPDVPDYSLPSLSKRWLKRGAVAAGVVLLAANIATVTTVVAGGNDFALMTRPDIIAHRGASADAPENTMAAFDKAIQQQSDYIELDVHATEDGVPVVIHDSTLGRTTDVEGDPRVSDMAYEDIRDLDAGSWFDPAFEGEGVPTLEAVFMHFGEEVPYFVEIKPESESLTEDVVALFEEYELEDSKIMSFEEEKLRHVKEQNEDIETVLLLAAVYGGGPGAVTRDDAFDHFAFEKRFLLNNTQYIDAAHRADKTAHVWTVNSEARLREVSRTGVDGIITDYPVRAREIAYAEQTTTVYEEILRYLFTRE